MGDYYYARWQMLLTRLEAAVQSGQPMDFDQYLTDLYAWEVVRLNGTAASAAAVAAP